MAQLLPEDEYQIVLIGISDKQKRDLNPKILAISKTNSPKELAQWYTEANVFLNLTYEDNFPTVNLEAQECGTPVITYNTGGSIESVPKDNIINQGDIEAVEQRIKSDHLELIKGWDNMTMASEYIELIRTTTKKT